MCLIAAVIALIGFFMRGGDLAETRPKRSELTDSRSATRAQLELCGPPSRDNHPVAVEMVYSDDMRPWIELATDVFSHRCPNIQIKLTAAPDIEAADAIFAGQMKPVLWAPTDEMALRYLEQRWKQRGGTIPFQAGGSKSLVESPLVLLIWQDRLRLLSALLHEDHSAEGLWVRAPCALIPKDPDLTGVPIEQMVPGTWQDWYAPFVTPLAATQPAGRDGKKPAGPPIQLPPIGDEPLTSLDDVKTWGRVKIGHAKPTRDSAGNAALFLMAYDYVFPPKERQALVQDGVDPPTSVTEDQQARDERVMLGFKKDFAENQTKFGKWLRRCEAGLDAQPTTPELTMDIFNSGPSAYDAVVTYEHLALPLLDRVDAHADELRRLVILYPAPTLLAQHPMVFFEGSAEAHEAARRWENFLLSKEMQEKAIEAGFRPVNPAVTISGYNVEANQFLRLRRYGVLIDPHLTEAPRPDGGQIQELINLWGEVTGEISPALGATISATLEAILASVPRFAVGRLGPDQARGRRSRGGRRSRLGGGRGGGLHALQHRGLALLGRRLGRRGRLGSRLDHRRPDRRRDHRRWHCRPLRGRSRRRSRRRTRRALGHRWGARRIAHVELHHHALRTAAEHDHLAVVRLGQLHRGVDAAPAQHVGRDLAGDEVEVANTRGLGALAIGLLLFPLELVPVGEHELLLVILLGDRVLDDPGQRDLGQLEALDKDIRPTPHRAA